MSTNEIHEGSLKALWKVSASLMISFLSMVAMMFFDRLFLAYYSTSALTAAASAGNLYWAGCFMWVTLAAMAEVFVAQYNGAKRYEKLGQPAWQMIYLSGASVIFFFILGHFGSELFYQSGLMNHDEMTYYRWNNYFAPLLTLMTAISAFYIGQGKTSIIKWLGLLGNGVNIILDPLFIFGYKGWIPSMGIKGAAIATGIGISVQVVIIAALFLRRKNWETFGTNDYRFKPALFWKCLKVGLPPAIFVLFELLGWTGFYMMMRQISSEHILVCSVTQSILILFIFFGLGLEKGAAAVAGNLIGAKKLDEVKQVLKSGVKLCLGFSLVLAVFLIGIPDLILEWFFKNPTALSSGEFTITPDALIQVKGAIKFAMAILVVYLTMENIRFLLSGLLTSAGDTLFLMVAGACSIWFFLLVPTYVFVLKPQGSIYTAFYIWLFYSMISSGIYALRFFHGKWKQKHLIEEKPEEKIPEIAT